MVRFSSQTWDSLIQFNTGYLCVYEREILRELEKEGGDIFHSQWPDLCRATQSSLSTFQTIHPLTVSPLSLFHKGHSGKYSTQIYEATLQNHTPKREENRPGGVFGYGVACKTGAESCASGLATSAWLVFHHPLLFHHPNPLFFWWSELLVHSNLARPVYRVLVNYVKKFGEKSRRYHRFKALYTFNRNFRWDRARQLGKAFRIPTSTVTDWLETAAETGYVASLILKQNFIDQVWHVFELIAERRE